MAQVKQQSVEKILDMIQKRNSLESKISSYLKTNSLGYKFFNEYFIPIFLKYPLLKSFGWNQGQYYNDQTYYYSVRCDSGSLEINGEIDGNWDENSPEINGNFWQAKAAEEIEDLLSIFSEDDHQALFGEDAKVVIFKDKIEIEDFDD